MFVQSLPRKDFGNQFYLLKHSKYQVYLIFEIQSFLNLIFTSKYTSDFFCYSPPPPPPLVVTRIFNPSPSQKRTLFWLAKTHTHVRQNITPPIMSHIHYGVAGVGAGEKLNQWGVNRKQPIGFLQETYFVKKIEQVWISWVFRIIVSSLHHEVKREC